jgi:anaerobic magnesium-protoporphyrin IX monomethyl ester cyclase
MSHILFTHSYFYRFDPKQWKAKQPYPPYGTLYAAALMRETGFEVSLFDVALRDSTLGLEAQLQANAAKYLVIYDDGFNYLTKMCLIRMREAAFEMVKIGKAKGIKVIVCSSDSTDHFEQYLSEGADFVIQGEGELTLRELVQALESGNNDFQDILGICYGSPLRQNPPRPVLQNLDELPDPAWDLVDMSAYRDIWMKHHGYFSLNMATTRGCPYKCNWCAKPIYGNRYNSRSPERVAAEAEYLSVVHGASYFWMADDIFGLKPQWVQGFRDALQKRNLKIAYKIQSRVDLLLKEDNIDALVASGLKQVWVGAESGSQKILDAMDKGTKVEEIHAATAILKKKGVEVCFFLQFGYLGEDRADIEATILMVEQLSPHDIGISVSYPLPGTKFYEKVRGLLGEKQNWKDSDELLMMYPATFRPEFYKRLHRLVHKRFRKKQGLMAWDALKNGQKTRFKPIAKLLYYIPAAKLDAWRLSKLEKNVV